MAKERTICFVIMPFSQTTPEHTEEHWTRHFDGFLKPLIEENPALEARRSTALRGDIVKEIISSLVVSPLVVAELTDANPNVYWELGVRQSFKHGTVTIALEGTPLPFDIGAKGTLFYNPGQYIRLEEFRRNFKLALEDCLAHPDRTDSHVLETVSGRGTIYELVRRDEAIRRVEALIDELTQNFTTLETIVTTAKENQDDPTKRKLPTGMMRHAACELLMTTRYLDQDRVFYGNVEACFGWATRLNTQLLLWEQGPGSTEQWMMKQAPKAKPGMEDLLKRLKQIHAEITAKI